MKKLFTFLFALSTVSASALTCTNGGATNLTRTTATLQATAGGIASNATLTFFHGRNDGSTNAALWTSSNAVGNVTSGAQSLTVSNLTPAALYYMAARLVETTNTVWSSSAQFSTLAGAPTSTPVIAYTNLPTIVSGLPGWLATTQTLATTTDANEAFSISPTNGASVFLYATNAISASRTITLNLDGQSTNALPLTLLVVAQPTIVTNGASVDTNTIVVTGISTLSLNYIWSDNMVNGAGAGWDAENRPEPYYPCILPDGSLWAYADTANQFQLYTMSGGGPTGTLTAVNTRWIWGSSTAADGTYPSNGVGGWTNAAGWLIDSSLEVLDDMSTDIGPLSGFSNFYPDQNAATSVFANGGTTYTTNIFSAAWSSNCVFAAGASTNLSTAVGIATNTFIGVSADALWKMAPH